MEAGHKGDAPWARRMAPKLETLFWPPTVSETFMVGVVERVLVSDYS